MAITSYDDFVAAEAAGYGANDTFYGQVGASTAVNIVSGNLLVWQNYGLNTPALPSLPSGKSYFVPTVFEAACSTTGMSALVKLTSFGSIDISGASGTFTDGSVAPTVTEGGVSRQRPSAVFGVVRTAISASPGSLTFTYVDQDNNAAEATTATAIAANAAAGTAGFFALNDADWGALDITAASRTGGGSPTGVIDFYHVRTLCTTQFLSANSGSLTNMLTDMCLLHQLEAGDSLAILTTRNAANGIMGRIHYLAM